MKRINSVLEVGVFNWWMASTLEEIGLIVLLPISCYFHVIAKKFDS